MGAGFRSLPHPLKKEWGFSFSVATPITIDIMGI
jgi:hypothetical protein